MGGSLSVEATEQTEFQQFWGKLRGASSVSEYISESRRLWHTLFFDLFKQPAVKKRTRNSRCSDKAHQGTQELQNMGSKF